MEYRILGPLEAFERGAPVTLGGPKQRALLAMLLLHANRVVSTERLVDGLWEEPPSGAVKAVQVYVSRLRRALGGTTPMSKAPGYTVQLAPWQLDLTRFRQLRDEARIHPAIAAEALQEALAMWRGTALEEFTTEPFARTERVGLEEERLEALQERIEADLVLGRHASLVGELESLVESQPLRERLRGQLMLALYRCGRQADSLAVYREGVRILGEELGIEPSRPLQQLERAILNQDASLEPLAAEAPAESIGSVFVGREHEMKQLSRGLDDAVAGRGRTFLLVGEPGIGKSWLADAVLARARRRGAQLLVGRCWEAGGAPAYWPWVQALRPYFHEASSETLREQLGTDAPQLAALFPELSVRLPELVALSSASEDARFRMFEALSAVLKAVASARPIVLFLDDLHAADEPSLVLLRFVVRDLARSRALIVGAYRDVDPTLHDPLSTAVSELVREPTVTRLELRGLTEDEIAKYVSITRGRAADAQEAARIYARTEGNPLFVAELVRLLEGAGDLVDSAALERTAVPQGVRDVIGKRLRSLSPGCREVLTRASVLGREFSVPVLAKLDGLDQDALVNILDEAVSARFIGEVPGAAGHLRFEHALFRDTLYREVTAPRRLQLHREAGEALEVVYGQRLEEHLAELAHHFVAAGPVVEAGKAVGYARRAAERAAEILAFEEAARLYRLILDMVADSADVNRSQRCELLLALGDVLARAGDMPRARDTFAEAAELAGQLGATVLLARAALGYGGRLLYARATPDDILVSLLTRAADALGPSDSTLKVRVLARHANAVSQDLPESSDTLTAQALAGAHRLQDPATLAYALSARLYATRAPTKLEERWALTDELILSADVERAFEAHAYRTIIEFARGDVAGIRTDLAAMARLAEKIGQPSQRWWVAATSATFALLEGRLDEAETLINLARTLGDRAENYDARNFFQLQRFALRREQGRLDEVVTELAETSRADPGRPILRCALALTYWELGHYQPARELLLPIAEMDYGQLPINNDWLLSAALLAELVAYSRDLARAEPLYHRLSPYEELNVDTEEVSTGAVSRYLGLLAATARRFDLAARHFQDALAMNRRMGARPWLARTEYDFARMLLARDRRGDRQRARELQRHAAATCRELGMHPYR